MARTNTKAASKVNPRRNPDPRLSAEEAETFVTALKERGIEHAKIGDL
ncbi:MAG: hypothetical protein R3B07_24630 [Polyangiaceae bacterium]